MCVDIRIEKMSTDTNAAENHLKGLLSALTKMSETDSQLKIQNESLVELANRMNKKLIDHDERLAYLSSQSEASKVELQGLKTACTDVNYNVESSFKTINAGLSVITEALDGNAENTKLIKDSLTNGIQSITDVQDKFATSIASLNKILIDQQEAILKLADFAKKLNASTLKEPPIKTKILVSELEENRKLLAKAISLIGTQKKN